MTTAKIAALQQIQGIQRFFKSPTVKDGIIFAFLYFVKGEFSSSYFLCLSRNFPLYPLPPVSGSVEKRPTWIVFTPIQPMPRQIQAWDKNISRLLPCRLCQQLQ